MLWSAALFFYVYYTPALPDCQRLRPCRIVNVPRRFQNLRKLQTLRKRRKLQTYTPLPARRGCNFLEKLEFLAGFAGEGP